MFLFYKLNRAISIYLSNEDRQQIAKAFLVGADAHETQIRSSGEPYITHPLAVATVLSGMQLDRDTIIAALLHDVLEDTKLTENDLTENFGEKVSELVAGVTKLTKIEYSSKAEYQAENLRKMMLAMVKDIRVILIKLADRLHNMTTLAPLRPDKRRRIATETLEIFAPIAHRLGMHHFKNSFEELAFESIHPYRYRILKEKVKRAELHRDKLFHKILEKLQHHLGEELLPKENISGRKKRLYSIYRKMRDRDMSFSEIMDIYAYKVIATDRRQCYLILGAIHEIFRPIPGRFKDYIATPKANGYQSLHTTVFGPYGVPVEIQIKTQMMEDTAERGVAAHWLYKSQNISHDNAKKWLSKLSDLQQQVSTSVDFVESVKLDLFPDEVYVFTPQGEIIELPKNATCVDFAYHIHTDVGNHCIAAKINRRISPLSYALKHGDTVEIVTSAVATPNPSWLEFIKTSRAKHAIRSALKRQENDQLLKIGKQMLIQLLSQYHLSLEQIDDEVMQQALVDFNQPSMNELYTNIGNGNFNPRSFVRLIAKNSNDNSLDIDDLVITISQSNDRHLASCCTPIPDDEISGVMVPEQGLEIHRIQCSIYKLLIHKKHNQIKVQWQDDIKSLFRTKLLISLENIQGAIAQVTASISRQDAHIISFNVKEADKQYGMVETVIEVHDRIHLAHIIRAIKRLKVCLRVERPLSK
ncbi:MAG: RelA/SpoT family protein [Francisellaceae bacterium]